MRVREIIDRFRTGKLLIPEFQRDYVWPKSNAPKLIESLYRSYPISSLLVWESAERVEVRRLEPRRDVGGPIGWLVDGQQRVITLVRTQSGDEDIDVIFSTESEKFTRSNAASKNDHRWVRVSDAWDDEWFRAYRKKLSDSPADKRIEDRLEKLRSVLNYEVPIVQMQDYTFEDAVESFRRLNSNGVRLKASDLESAKVAGQHAGFVRKKVIRFFSGSGNADIVVFPQPISSERAPSSHTLTEGEGPPFTNFTRRTSKRLGGEPKTPSNAP
jgi:hypothetical protein